MPPDRADVEAMTAVLLRVSGNIARARRQRKGASAMTLLQAVADAGSARPSELATHVGLSRAAVTRQAQELAARGAVEMTVDPADRRSCFVALTEAGRHQLATLNDRGLARWTTFTAEWGGRDLRELTRLLTRLEASIAKAVRHEEPITAKPWRRPPTADPPTTPAGGEP